MPTDEIDDFWGLTGDEPVAQEYESETGGNFDPIPEGSTVLAYIKAAKWKESPDKDFKTKEPIPVGRYVDITWVIEAPEMYKNRHIFQKLWAGPDLDPSKDVEKAEKKQMEDRKRLRIIDGNCGAKLARKKHEPTDDDLHLALTTAQMAITLAQWDIGGKIGNWVCGIGPKTKPLKIGEVKASKSSSAKASAADIDDDIPF